MTDKIEMNVPIQAPPAPVFRALIDANELEQWFAERASVSCEKKAYDFWGRFTPGAPSETDGRHRLLACKKTRNSVSSGRFGATRRASISSSSRARAERS